METEFKELDEAIDASKNFELKYSHIIENLKKSVNETLEVLLDDDPDHIFQRKIWIQECRLYKFRWTGRNIWKGYRE